MKIQPKVDNTNADIRRRAYENLSDPALMNKTPEELAAIKQLELQDQNNREYEENDRKRKE
jgi:hypothetical protein